MTFYYVILVKRSYTREDTRLHTLISYVLLVHYIGLWHLYGWKGAGGRNGGGRQKSDLIYQCLRGHFLFGLTVLDVIEEEVSCYY